MQSDENDGVTHVRCPGCGHPKTVLLAVGQQLQCDTCHTVFFAPVAGADDMDTPEIDDIVLDADPIHHEPALPDAATKTMILSSDATPPPTIDAKTEPPADDVPEPRPRRVEVARPNAPSGSPPPSAVQTGTGKSGETEPETEQPPEQPRPPRRWRRLLIPIVSIALFAAVTVAAVVIFRIAVDDEPASPGSVSGGKTPRRPSVVQPLAWSDASRFSQRLGKIRVKVKQVRFGSVTAKDKKNRVIVTDNDHLLFILLQIRNRSGKPQSFHSWYGTTFTDATGEPLLAELSDDRGELYSLLDFEDVSRIEGQHFGDQIDTGETVQDSIVFLIPPDTDRKAIKYFRLKLPAVAVDAPGFFCFQIPVSMIDQF